MSEQEYAEPTNTVLPPTFGKGPHGLGDPDDRTLRRVEVEIKVPQILRDRAKQEKCVQEVKDFHECCTQSGLLMTFKCKKQNDVMKTCLETWYRDEGFKRECTDMYLEQRKQYRLTGKKLEMKRKESDMF